MKKVILSLAVIATMGCFASCKKTCDCTTYLLGSEINTYSATLETLQEVYPNATKCSDITPVTSDLLGGKNGDECK